MDLIGSIILGLICMAIGVALLRYYPQWSQQVGRFEWAERYIAGGTYIVWLGGGFALIILGFLLTFGLLDNLFAWLVSPFKLNL